MLSHVLQEVLIRHSLATNSERAAAGAPDHLYLFCIYLGPSCIVRKIAQTCKKAACLDPTRPHASVCELRHYTRSPGLSPVADLLLTLLDALASEEVCKVRLGRAVPKAPLLQRQLEQGIVGVRARPRDRPDFSQQLHPDDMSPHVAKTIARLSGREFESGR